MDNNDETSAYATLLLHTPWPCDGEQAIVQMNETAVKKLLVMTTTDKLPTYVVPMLNRQRQSTTITENYGENVNNDIDDTQYEAEHTNDRSTDIITTYIDPIYADQLDLTMSTDELTTDLSDSRHTFYKNFIHNAQSDYLDKEKKINQVNETSIATSFCSTISNIQLVENYEERCQLLSEDIKKLTTGQRDAYDKAVKHISGNDPTQLIMFISGEGGTGKSFIIALIMEYTRLRYGKQKGLYGAAVAMAPTGCAANVVKGYTWQSSYGKGRATDNTEKVSMTQETARKVGEKFKGTKLAVLDEVSMINLESISEISKRHQQALLSVTDDPTEKEAINAKPFGGMHILFTGDLWQLKAIGGHPIYTQKPLSGRAALGQKIWHSINEYSELTENYRFKDDVTPTLQNFLRGARQGNVNGDLLNDMNKRIVLSRAQAVREAHPDACWIAHTKKSVKTLNDADFCEKVDAGVLHFRIIATHSPAEDTYPMPGEDDRLILFQTTKLAGPPTHIDLAIGSRVSCVQNLGTQIGKFSYY